MAYTDWDARYHELLDADGRVSEAWRAHVPPFDPAASRATRDNGVLPEFHPHDAGRAAQRQSRRLRRRARREGRLG